MMFTRGFSLTNFLIASSALGFQVFVLYPWHHKLENEFQDLKRDHLEILQKSQAERLEEIRDIKKLLLSNSNTR
jgi:hypothetical protein